MILNPPLVNKPDILTHFL